MANFAIVYTDKYAYILFFHSNNINLTTSLNTTKFEALR